MLSKTLAQIGRAAPAALTILIAVTVGTGMFSAVSELGVLV